MRTQRTITCGLAASLVIGCSIINRFEDYTRPGEGGAGGAAGNRPGFAGGLLGEAGQSPTQRTAGGAGGLDAPVAVGGDEAVAAAGGEAGGAGGHDGSTVPPMSSGGNPSGGNAVGPGGGAGETTSPGGAGGGQAGATPDDLWCQEGEERSCADAGLQGPCAAGVQTCQGGVWGPCSVAPEPTDSCDTEGDDANCDGRANGGCICIVGHTQTCAQSGALGNCAAGIETCLSDATWSSCSVIAEGPDACTADDDADCNGVPNEGCECVEGATRTCEEDGLYGKCAAGIQACDAATGSWSACSIQPSAADTCAPGNDDNCNGIVNEGCPCIAGDTRVCSQGGFFGKCAAGTQACDAAAGQWGACSIQPSAADTCIAGNDDDCDGIANEGCLCILGATRTCGPCGDGEQACTDGKAGTYGTCTGGTQPITYYRDADGDGRGNPDVTSATCSSAPTGYVISSDDCCDSNSLVRPGSTAWYADPQTSCPLIPAYDYNCDGSETQEVSQYFQAVGGCTNCEMANGVGYWNWGPGDWPIPACGDDGSFFATCTPNASGGCSSAAITRTQRCH